MLSHIVLYKLKPGTTPDQVQRLLTEARQRLSRISGVMNLRAGISIYPEETYQCGLVMDFDDEAALDRYRVDPIHIGFVEEMVNQFVDEVRRLDYLE